MKFLGVEFAPLFIPWERRMQTMAIIFFVFIFLQGLSLIGIFMMISLLYTDYYWLSLLYIAWYYIDYETCHYGGRTVKWTRSWKLWDFFCGYFPMVSFFCFWFGYLNFDLL